MKSCFWLRAFFKIGILSVLLTTVCYLRAAESTNAPVGLKGIVLVNAPEAVLKEGDAALSAEGIQIRDLPLLKGPDFEKRLRRFFGRAIDADLLKDMQTAVRTYYREKGFPLVDTAFPPQTSVNGVLQLIVVESKLGKINFEGTNKWTRTDYIRKNLHLTQAEPINEQLLLGDLNWLNRLNRFRSIDAFYKPGENRFESDLVVRTSERVPLGGSISFDDAGTKLTGEDRLTAGIEWGKAFGLQDNLLSYRYITDTEFKFLKAHAVTYQMPLPWRHTLMFSGSYSDVQGNIPGRPITQKGSSYQAELRYEFPLPTLGGYRQSAYVGGDYRRMDNNLEFNFVNVLAETTEVFQGVVGYSGLLPDAWGSTFVGVEGYYSPGGVTDRNTDAGYTKSFPGAEAEYKYAKFNLERITRLPLGSSWRLSGAYQIADGNLLPSEQFGLGGPFTVRGYEERATAGAEGFLVSNELRLPSFSPAKWLDKSAKDELQLLGFFDYGETMNRILQRGEDPHVLLMSAGAGLRYRVSRFLTVRFDYGWQLTDPKSIADSPNSRGHVLAEFRY